MCRGSNKCTQNPGLSLSSASDPRPYGSHLHSFAPLKGLHRFRSPPGAGYGVSKRFINITDSLLVQPFRRFASWWGRLGVGCGGGSPAVCPAGVFGAEVRMLCRTVFFRRFGGGVRLVMRRRLGYPVGVWVQSPSTHARGGAWHGEARRGRAWQGMDVGVRLLNAHSPSQCRSCGGYESPAY